MDEHGLGVAQVHVQPAGLELLLDLARGVAAEIGHDAESAARKTQPGWGIVVREYSIGHVAEDRFDWWRDATGAQFGREQLTYLVLALARRDRAHDSDRFVDCQPMGSRPFMLLPQSRTEAGSPVTHSEFRIRPVMAATSLGPPDRRVLSVLVALTGGE